ncbi:MAG: hypothetical protein ISR69_13460 [Gammaproteobacteria bacterium]|nr:hypothetical protein [Candidatus Brocadiales bacterium]MBL7005019.1 hypothetical protein [Gammaproteobacteria bacterium]
MNTRDIESLAALYDFPQKGTAVIGYFVERGEVSGAFYVAIVEQSGGKQYRLRWADFSTEIFKSIQGKNSRYQYFHILGYIQLSDYRQLCYERIRWIDDLPEIQGEPSEDVVASYRRQAQKVSELQKLYERERADIPSEISDGRPIVFIHCRCLDKPTIVDGAFTRIYDGIVYVNLDDDLDQTNDEDLFLYIPRQMILSVG